MLTHLAGHLCLLGTIPLLAFAVEHLAGRAYVAGALMVFAAAAVGHMGVELLALRKAESE